MTLEHLRPAAATQQTRLVAAICLEKLTAENVGHACLAASPYRAIQAFARTLERDVMTEGKVWVVNASQGTSAPGVQPTRDAGTGTRNISAWPLWFRDGPGRFEVPLLYLLRSESVAGLRAAIFEAAEHGILCNDAEATSSRWPKSVQPAVPLWLASSLNCIPYDPASGQETLAILRSALQTLYIDNEPGCFYMALHADDSEVPISAQTDVQDAYKGMYRINAASRSRSPAIRLLGAGKALGTVIRAAGLLQTDWNIPSEVWSCPSYTRLAREGYAVEHWNTLHPLSPKKTPYIQACLGSEQSPVLAVTGYERHIASQIGGFVCARFVAMGADSDRGVSRSPTAQWIVATALKTLGDEGTLSMRHAEQALKRYALI
ncbi:transketolase-like TK C-terminal-containing protein [Bordetella muralis]|jgi:hypothetical protein|uniref:transketolase-like TK C-terminal-containing protein n=1 Tax=Bordetella muralis TaxID=1649130 RepID=UPI0039F0009E